MEKAIEEGCERLMRTAGGPIWRHHRVMPEARVEHGISLAIEYFREEDGRWLGDIPALPGATSYGPTRNQATVAVQALRYV
jgi:hypothetical protein